MISGSKEKSVQLKWASYTKNWRQNYRVFEMNVVLSSIWILMQDIQDIFQEK